MTALKATMDLLDGGKMEADVARTLQEKIAQLQEKTERNQNIAQQIALRQGMQIDPNTNPKLVRPEGQNQNSRVYVSAPSDRSL